MCLADDRKQRFRNVGTVSLPGQRPVFMDPPIQSAGDGYLYTMRKVVIRRLNRRIRSYRHYPSAPPPEPPSSMTMPISAFCAREPRA